MKKRYQVLSLVVGFAMIFSIAGFGCKKEEPKGRAPESAKVVEVAGFEVSNGTLGKGGLGNILSSSEKDKLGVALKKTETSFKNSMTVKCQMKSLSPSGHRNGFIAFGKTKQWAKAGVLVGAMQYMIDGPFVKEVKESIKFDQNKVFDLELTVNIKEKVITLKVDGKEVKTKITGELDSINYIGYVVGDAKTEFSDLQISGN